MLILSGLSDVTHRTAIPGNVGSGIRLTLTHTRHECEQFTLSLLIHHVHATCTQERADQSRQRQLTLALVRLGPERPQHVRGTLPHTRGHRHLVNLVRVTSGIGDDAVTGIRDHRQQATILIPHAGKRLSERGTLVPGTLPRPALRPHLTHIAGLVLLRACPARPLRQATIRTRATQHRVKNVPGNPGAPATLTHSLQVRERRTQSISRVLVLQRTSKHIDLLVARTRRPTLTELLLKDPCRRQLRRRSIESLVTEHRLHQRTGMTHVRHIQRPVTCLHSDLSVP